MSDERLVSLRNQWFVASVGATLAVFLFSAFVGFIWLPSVQKDAQFQGLWNAICSAAGVPRTWYSEAPVESTVRTSSVIVTPQMLEHSSPVSIGRGATLAMRCTMCHGVRGLSEANSPNLAGQYAAVVYKELQDFRSGARTSAIMTPMVAGLSDQDMKDLAAYYSYLPRLHAYHPGSAGDAPRIVMSGAPMRNIAPCASCHGGIASKAGAPWLEGQPAVYIRTQLQAFASEERRNDISEQMRNVARQMTPAEIEEAARYYSSQP
ncbi:c-type cytochrome [Paraburkholderia sp. BCC1885]|uniref:c-type cytochrome n=1 Tax=Paraburkholderia sp. BCC1885 TaxID=2562669 RepID=UPI00118223E5|nr:c-type cytochrome [Paraburkholderia sp. BCC1885]